jgi:hypothetical protein
VVASVTPGDFVPRVTGGVSAVTELDPGEDVKVNQPLATTYEVVGKRFAALVVQVSYTDVDGVAYTETFNLSLPVKGASGPFYTATPTPTATAAPVQRPQIVITSYRADPPTLQPGYQFVLELEAENVGNLAAQRVTMILGGGSSSSGGQSGTPEPGGVSGGTGDLTNFAPVNASNVQYLGDVNAGESFRAQATLIVNSATNPGAYPMKISFTYTGENGINYTDDQVVTLLIYSPPNVEVNFYRDPGILFVGQPNQLPLQVVNLGRKAVLLGNMVVTGEGAEFMNNSTLVGMLDTGGYYTLDAVMIPSQPGPLDLIVTIDYTDDFNQSQVITKTLSVEIQDAPVVEPPPDGSGVPGEGIPGEGTGFPSQPETSWQKTVRLLKGLFGLDSAQPAQEFPGEFPPVEVPQEEIPPGKPIPLPAGKG